MSVMYFNYTHWVIMSVASVCSLWKHKQLTHLISGASEINKLSFFGLLCHFFRGRMDAHCFWARPLKIAQGFFSTFLLRFGCVLEETHGTTYLEVVRRCWRKDRNFNIKFNVTELYVIKSWWKIKFNKRKV